MSGPGSAPEPLHGHSDPAARTLERYPRLRYMGSKFRLIPWIAEVLGAIDFQTAGDPFCGSGVVAYLLKTMGKTVRAGDFMHLGAVLARALVENPGRTLRERDIAHLTADDVDRPGFIETMFRGIFFTPADLRFLDRVSAHLDRIADPYREALARAAMIRSCAKRQPRGVFTVAGDPERYKDGRRDLRLSIEQHFTEQVDVFNAAVFDDGRPHMAVRADVFSFDPGGLDLVYLDPPYIPRSDDNCYMKRYHFLEGLACDWDGCEIMMSSKVRKIAKPKTPFSYRRLAEEAFTALFEQFKRSIIVLSYSSNGYPDLDRLVDWMGRVKESVVVHERGHRYHFGTHAAAKRTQVAEYLIVGR